MNRLNEILDYLVMEIDNVRAVVGALKNLLEACPNCSVKRADTIVRLADIADNLAVAAAKVHQLKEDEGTSEKTN